MDKNLFMQYLAQQKGQGGQPGGQPAGGEGDMSAMLQQLMGQMGGQQGASAPQQPQMATGPANVMQGGPEMPPDETQAGQTADSTKPLIQAMQGLHNYIASSQDRNDIQIARSIMTLLTRLITSDQQKRATQGEEPQAQPQGPQQPPMPGGM